jgi:hypothetical protein
MQSPGLNDITSMVMRYRDLRDALADNRDPELETLLDNLGDAIDAVDSYVTDD